MIYLVQSQNDRIDFAQRGDLVVDAYISYLRVSTERQGDDGLGIEAQRSSISRFVNTTQAELLTEYVEVESGKKAARPVLHEAIQACRQRKATLVVAKLDRLSRTVSFMSELIDAKVDFVAADNPHANKLMIHVLAAFAEHERDLISTRTKASLAAAKARGVALGGPRLTEAREAALVVLKRNARTRAANTLPIIDQIRAAGVLDLRGIASSLNRRGIATARGGRWHASTVRNVLRYR